MKKWLLPFSLLLAIVVISCNNNEHNAKAQTITSKAPKTLEDSLMKDIDDGHILGMSKMAKLHKAQQNARRMLDSIATLPAKAQKAC